jgi:hypothetical protein
MMNRYVLNLKQMYEFARIGCGKQKTGRLLPPGSVMKS